MSITTINDSEINVEKSCNIVFNLESEIEPKLPTRTSVNGVQNKIN